MSDSEPTSKVTRTRHGLIRDAAAVDAANAVPEEQIPEAIEYTAAFLNRLAQRLPPPPMIESLSASLGKRQYPGCSCHACGGISPAGDPPGTWFNTCQSCQHKRCPHCDNHRFECTESNAPGQVGTLSTKGGDA